MPIPCARALLMGTLLIVTATGCRATREPEPWMQVTRFAESDWRLVLQEAVSDDGHFVDYALLEDETAGVRDALTRYVEQVGLVSPENRPDLFPTTEDHLAYYINAYNSLAMYAVLERGVPDDLWRASIWPGAIFSVDRFPVGGRGMTLEEIERRLRRAAGDPRIAFALNRMSRSSPPLLRRPYDGPRLDAQLAAAARLFLSDPVAVRRANAHVRINELLSDWYLDEWTADGEIDLIDALAPHAAEDSPLHGAETWEVMPHDWTVNRRAE